MLLGYDLLDYDAIHYHYCVECYDQCDPWFQYRVMDTIEDPFKCDGCHQDIGGDE